MENLLYNDFSGNVGQTIKLTKRIKNKDVSAINAFSVEDKVLFTVSAPRRAGIISVTMLIERDGCKRQEIDFEVLSEYAGDDVYKAKLDMAELCAPFDNGLFFYKLRFEIGCKYYYTNSINNVDYTLTEKEERSFCMLVHSKDFKTPEWATAGTMYHIFVDRFYEGSKKMPLREDAVRNDNWENGIPEYAPYPGAHLENNEFFGGNLWGVAEKLDYLKELGVNIIYLSPIFESYSNHKYDTGNYMKVDDMFGGDEAFANLINEANKRSIKIILDGVFNHTGDKSIYFDKNKKYGSVGAFNNYDSEYRGWFHFHPDNTYESWWGIQILPKLNHHNDNCRHYFTDHGGVIEKYIKEGIGGWRLDVADELSNEFLDELRSVAKEANDQALIIGEVWENAADKVAYDKRREYFRGRQLDSVMNYPFKNALTEYIKYGESEILYDELTEVYSSYPVCVSNVLMNLLGTHDTERILTVLSDDDPNGKSIDEIATSKLTNEQKETAVKRLKLASTIQYTVYGFPSVFYGDEAGMEGYGDPFCRKPFPWHNISKELHEHYKKLGNIRRTNTAFAGGSFEILEHRNGLISYKRKKAKCEVVVCANAGSSSESLELSGIYKDLITDKVFTNLITVEPMTAMILKKQ